MNKYSVEEVSEDIAKYKSISSLCNLDGGKILIDSLESDVRSSIENIISGYKKLNHIEIIALVAKLEANLNLLKVLTRADKNLEFAQEEYKKMLIPE